MKALVVDDSRSVRLIIGRILGEIGFETVEAENGRVALERLGEGPFELAMVDWNMPEMTGIELLDALKAGAAPRPRHIVMVTTENEIANVIRALEAGANEYVMKPFTREVIAEKLALLGIEVH